MIIVDNSPALLAIQKGLVTSDNCAYQKNGCSTTIEILYYQYDDKEKESWNFVLLQLSAYMSDGYSARCYFYGIVSPFTFSSYVSAFFKFLKDPFVELH